MEDDLTKLVSDLILKIEQKNKLIELLETKVDLLYVQLTTIRMENSRTMDDFGSLKNRFEIIKNDIDNFQQRLSQFENTYINPKPIQPKPLLEIG